MKDIFAEPWDPDAPLRDRLIARGPALAVAAAMIVITTRMIWLWTSGIIKTEPFFGSNAWNIAIALPAVAIFGTWWVHSLVVERKRERELSHLMAAEPLAGWHRRIRPLDTKLESGTPRSDVDIKIWRLTVEIVDAYPQLDAIRREHVRLLWSTYANFGLYASVTDRLEDEEALEDKPLTVEEVSRELILHSIRDQSTDARDTLVDLSDLQSRATAAGIDFAALAREVADLSNDSRRDGLFGSMREMILRFA